MKKIFFIVFLSVCIFAFCDAYKITFKGSYGFNIFARTLLSASNEEYIVGGNTTNTNDAILAKLNYKGEIIWAKVFGGEQLDMVRLVLTVDGNFLLLANTFSTDTGSPDVLLFLINGNGEILKQKKLGDDGYDFGISIIQVSNGGFVMLGYKIFSYNKYFWIAKLNSNLEIEWERIIGSPGSNILPRDVVETGTGYILIGYEDYFSSYDYSYAVKIDTSGNLLWQKKYSAQDSYFNMEDIVFDDLNCSIVAIERDHSTYIANIKIDPNGTPIYSRFYYGNFDAPQTNSIKEADGSIVISSAYNSEVFIAKFNSNYGLLWAKHYIDEPVNVYTAIQKCQDGGYAFLGGANGIWGFNIFKADNLGEIGKECQEVENITLPEIGKIISAENSNLNVSNISSTYIDTNITFYEFQVSYSICYPNLQLAISANPINGNAPLSVMFTSNVKGGILPYFYDWDFGDETAHSSQANPNHIYQKVGVYHPYLKVWDSNNPPTEAIAEPLTIAVFSIEINLLLDPKEGTTAGGTIMHIYGKQKAFEQGADVYFDLSNSCPQNEGTKIPAESVEYIDSSHLQVKTPRAYEGPVSIFVDNPTIEDICQTSAYNYKTLAFTANQVTQDISIIDTKENKIFEPKGQFNFSGEIIPMSSALSKGNSPARKIYIANKHGGTIEIYDSSNFKYEASVNLMGEGYVNKSAFDIDISSSNKYGYVPLGFRCPAAYDNPSYPGGITIIDLENNSLVDADNDIQTTTFCAPEGISRIDTYPMYPVSLKVVGLEKSICDYGEGEKYPGEYLFVSGTFRPFELPPCEPGRICPPLIFPPTKMGVQVYDISPYIARYPKNPPVTEPPDACRLPNLEPNPDYLKRVAFFGDGSNPSEDIYSIQGLDFAIHQNGVPTGATVYILNPYENYAYIVEYDAVTVTFSLKTNPDGTLFKIPTGQSPTDVKVQKVSTQTGYQTFAYITNALDDSVTVIDTATNQELPWPQSPIFEDYCYDSENYPTSFDTRSTGDFGYSTNFHSNTVSPFYLPTNSCYSPPNSDGAIHVGEAPIRIVVQPVPSGELFFKNVKDALSFATPSDFTTPSKQAVLIRDWEKVQELQETNANPKAVLSNIENFQKNVNKWIVNENLKKNINENMNLYRAGYILDHPEVK